MEAHLDLMFGQNWDFQRDYLMRLMMKNFRTCYLGIH